ncbi:MAG: hypothetical protein WCL06_06590 [Bacteroidota bacterium]
MNKKWSFIERTVFLLFAVANAYPILAYHFFVTLDGAPHLYNAHCIKEILLGNEYLKGFIQLNPFPNPNWTGHFILASANFFVPGWLAEKAFLLIYILGLPYAFRYLIKTLTPENYLGSYLIFPFSYTYMLFLGFYNFSISLVLLFLTIAFWIRHKDKLNLLKIAVMMLLVTATYFSHASIYGILLPILFLVMFIDETLTFAGGRKKRKEYFRSVLMKTGVLALSYLVTAWWALQFLLSKPPSISSYLSNHEMLKNIKGITPILGFVESNEVAFTKKIFYVLFILALTTLVLRIMYLFSGSGFTFKRPWELLKKLFNKGDVWLALSALFMLAYYMLPDSDGWAGYFSLRILLLFFLIFIVWLAIQKIWKPILFTAVTLMLFFYIQLTVCRDKTSKELNQAASQCYKASEFIRPNSTVFPVNCSGNWLYGHFDKYLGIDKPLVLLDNNECNQNYFPLRWNANKIPQVFVDETGEVDRCYTFPYIGKNGRRRADYIFIMGRPDTNKTCDKKLIVIIKEHYQQVYTDSLVYVYKNQ